MTKICKYKTFKKLKKHFGFDGNYFDFAVWTPFILWIQKILYYITGKNIYLT